VLSKAVVAHPNTRVLLGALWFVAPILAASIHTSRESGPDGVRELLKRSVGVHGGRKGVKSNRVRAVPNAAKPPA
jgi:hypothetical protein